MFKHIKFAALALLLAGGFAACSDDENDIITPPYTPTAGEEGFFVVNQGSYYSGIGGSMDYYSFSADTYTSNLFTATNNQELGSTPQKPVIYGSKMYVPMYGENLVWVLRASDLSIIGSVPTPQPEAVCGAEGYVFVACNDGTVARIDTLSLTQDTPVSVGPNPMGIAATGGKVYVSISNSYGDVNAAEGKKVAVLDASTFAKEQEIAVGVNPTQLVAVGNDCVYVACQGDFSAVYPKVWKIDVTEGTATEFAAGNMLAYGGAQHPYLYVINYGSMYGADWSVSDTYYTSAVYNAATGEEVKSAIFADADKPVSPIALDVNPATGDVYVCTRSSAYGYTDAGQVKVYNPDGTPTHTYATGVEPYGVVFK